GVRVPVFFADTHEGREGRRRQMTNLVGHHIAWRQADKGCGKVRGVKGRRILFYDPDHKVRRIAERALLATQSDVELADDEPDMIKKTAERQYDLLMVNFDPPIAGD